MGKKLASKKEKNFWTKTWEIFKSPEVKHPGYLFLLAIGVAAFAYFFHKFESQFYLVIVYGYLSLWIFFLFLQAVTYKWNNFLSTIISFVAKVLSILPILIATIVDWLCDKLVALKFRSFAKHIVAVLLAIISTLFLIVFPMLNEIQSYETADGTLDIPANVIKYFVFISIFAAYVLTYAFLYLGIRFNDTVYQNCSGKLQKKNYVSIVYEEAYLFFTIVVLAANIFIKLFDVIPELPAEFKDALFVTTTIITLLNTCISKWKAIREEKYYNPAA